MSTEDGVSSVEDLEAVDMRGSIERDGAVLEMKDKNMAVKVWHKKCESKTWVFVNRSPVKSGMIGERHWLIVIVSSLMVMYSRVWPW